MRFFTYLFTILVSSTVLSVAEAQSADDGGNEATSEQLRPELSLRSAVIGGVRFDFLRGESSALTVGVDPVLSSAMLRARIGVGGFSAFTVLEFARLLGSYDDQSVGTFEWWVKHDPILQLWLSYEYDGWLRVTGGRVNTLIGPARADTPPDLLNFATFPMEELVTPLFDSGVMVDVFGQWGMLTFGVVSGDGFLPPQDRWPDFVGRIHLTPTGGAIMLDVYGQAGVQPNLHWRHNGGVALRLEKSDVVLSGEMNYAYAPDVAGNDFRRHTGLGWIISLSYRPVHAVEFFGRYNGWNAKLADRIDASHAFAVGGNVWFVDDVGLRLMLERARGGLADQTTVWLMFQLAK